jgi:hypothetical protein
MKLSLCLTILAGSSLLWGCLGNNNTSACRFSDSRSVQPPGTKITKDESKDLCACETVANEHSVCCDGCRFGDAIICRSSTEFGPDGFGVNVCAGQSEVEEPDPKCSLDEPSVTAITYPPLQYVGNNSSGPSDFQWGWFNPHAEKLPTSADLETAGTIQDPLILYALHTYPDFNEAEVSWTQQIEPCQSIPASKTIELYKEGGWTVTIKNLPGFEPEPVSLHLIDSIDP